MPKLTRPTCSVLESKNPVPAPSSATEARRPLRFLCRSFEFRFQPGRGAFETTDDIACPIHIFHAALLHDAVEDQEVPFEIIAQMFGDDVASLVKEVTDDKTKHKQDRKDHQVKHAHKASHRAKVLKLADKTSNLKSLAAGPPKDWSVKRRMEYVNWARDVVRGLKGASPWLEAEFEAAAKEAERSTIFRR